MSFQYLVPTSVTDTGPLLTLSTVTNIDETCESGSLDSTYNTTETDDNTNVAAAVWQLSDISTWGEVVGVTFRVNASVQSISNDTCTYRLRLNAGGSTYDINFTNTDGSYTTKTIAVGAGFSEAQYNAATVELVQTAHNKSAGPDGYYLSIDAIDLVIEFTDDVNIISDYDTLSITAYDSDVNDKTMIVSDYETLSITDYDSNVRFFVNIVSDHDTLSITAYDSDVNDKTMIVSDYDTLGITTYPSTYAGLLFNINSDFDTMVITAYDSDVNDKTMIVSNYDTLTITAYDSVAQLDKNIISDYDTLSISSYDSFIRTGIKTIVSDFATLSITAYPTALNVKKQIVSNYEILTLASYDSQVKLVITGLFNISGQFLFHGNWTISDT